MVLFGALPMCVGTHIPIDDRMYAPGLAQGYLSVLGDIDPLVLPVLAQ